MQSRRIKFLDGDVLPGGVIKEALYMAGRKKPPALVNVARHGEEKEPYRVMAMRILSTHDERTFNGEKIPFEGRFIDDDELLEIMNSDEFIIVYVPVSVFGLGPK